MYLNLASHLTSTGINQLWVADITSIRLRGNIAVFIDQYYNRMQLHSALGYRPPEEFEHAVALIDPSGAATIQLFSQQKALTLRE